MVRQKSVSSTGPEQRRGLFPAPFVLRGPTRLVFRRSGDWQMLTTPNAWNQRKHRKQQGRTEQVRQQVARIPSVQSQTEDRAENPRHGGSGLVNAEYLALTIGIASPRHQSLRRRRQQGETDNCK